MRKFSFALVFIALAIVSFAFIIPHPRPLPVKVKKAQGAVPINHDESSTVTFTYNDPCSGEVIDMTETSEVSIRGVINGNRINVNRHISTKDVGVGQSSGNLYTGNGEYNAVSTGLLSTNGAFVGNEVLNYSVVTAGGGNNIKVHSYYHITINANGQVTVQRGDYSAECQ